jgi:hypothetical protein
MGNNRFFSQGISMGTALALVLAPLSPALAAGQLGSQAATGALNSAGQAASNLAGTNSIAQGNANQQQGESTQNMAQMALGAMQIAQGILGLLAGMQAGKNANTAGYRGSNLDTFNSGLNPYSSTSPTPQSAKPETGGASLGAGAVANNVSSIDLKKEPINSALASIQKNYGISPDAFMNALQNGVDPKDIFAKAPKNAVSPELLGRISDSLAASNAAAAQEAAKGIADAAGSTTGGAGTLAQAGGAGSGAPTGSTEASSAGPRIPASTAPDALEDLSAAANVQLSPEIKAALAAKAEQLRREKEMKESHGWTFFQLVANRYRKLEPMLYGRVERTNSGPVPPQLNN